MRATIPIFAGILFAAASLVHCGSPAHAEQSKATCSCDAPVVKSGSRLKARVLKSDDGAQQFLRWYDTALGTTCSYFTGAGGAAVDALDGRCVPDVYARAGAYFSDSSCSVPAGWTLPGSDAAVFCFSADGLAPRGPSVVGPVYSMDGGACDVASDPTTRLSGVRFYDCGALSVPATTFALMTEADAG